MMAAALQTGCILAANSSSRQARGSQAGRTALPGGSRLGRGTFVQGTPVRHFPAAQLAWQQTQRRQVITAGLFGLGLPELAVIAGVAALIFGPSKLPEIGKGLGKTVKSFQVAAKEFEEELKTAAADGAEEAKPETGADKKPPLN